MPWDIVKDHPDCSEENPVAVVDKVTEEVVACHPTQGSAADQQAALYAEEDGRTSMSDEVLYRSFTPDLEVRRKGDGRTVTGIAVPYDYPQRIDRNLIEQFSRGAFGSPEELARGANKVKLARDHLPMGGSLIGVATLLRDESEGLYGEFRVSNTPAGDETLELIKDGALSELSVGFREGRNRKLDGGIVERVSADLREVAVVLQGAYGGMATIGGVRNLTNEDQERMREQNQQIQELLDTTDKCRA